MRPSISVHVFTAAVVMFLAGTAWSDAIPVSSYVYDVKNPTGNSNTNAAYQDNGASPGTLVANTELTDGKFPAVGSSVQFTDNRWVGVQNSTDDGLAQPQVTFDLGSGYNLNTFTVVYDVHHNPQIYAPDRVDVSYSNSPSSGFSTPTSLTGFDDTQVAGGTGDTNPITRSTTFSFPGGAAGRYVRLAFFNDKEWTFLAEVSFDGTPVPEPASAGVLAAALPLLARRPRRNDRE